MRFASRYDTRRAKRLEAVHGGRRRTIRPEEGGTAEVKPVPLKEAAIQHSSLPALTPLRALVRLCPHDALAVRPSRAKLAWTLCLSVRPKTAFLFATLSV